LDNDGVEIVCEKMSNNCVLKNLSLAISMEGRMGASLGSMFGINVGNKFNLRFFGSERQSFGPQWSKSAASAAYMSCYRPTP
jgi:hypothetical protein